MSQYQELIKAEGTKERPTSLHPWRSPPSMQNIHATFEPCENYEVERQRYNKQINYTQEGSFLPRPERYSECDTVA